MIEMARARSLQQSKARVLEEASSEVSKASNKVYYSSQIKRNRSRLRYFDWDEIRRLWLSLPD